MEARPQGRVTAEGVEESRSTRRPPCNGADRARASGRYPARKGADFRQVSAEAMDLDASAGRPVLRGALDSNVVAPTRRSLTDWFTDEAVAAWHAEPRTTPGGQLHYSALAITTALTLKAGLMVWTPPNGLSVPEWGC